MLFGGGGGGFWPPKQARPAPKPDAHSAPQPQLEAEQEAIVLRLTKAISQLRQEKAQLALDVEREEEVGGSISNVDV